MAAYALGQLIFGPIADAYRLSNHDRGVAKGVKAGAYQELPLARPTAYLVSSSAAKRTLNGNARMAETGRVLPILAWRG
jgi:hypothetical protein